MKFVIQRVTEASCTVDGNVTGAIQKGFLVLIGIADTDTTAIADKMIKKLLGLRIFEDADGKTNLSLADVGGSLLLISQFTLYADCRKGNRPSFVRAGKPEMASRMYDYIVARCKEQIPDTGWLKYQESPNCPRIAFAAQRKYPWITPVSRPYDAFNCATHSS